MFNGARFVRLILTVVILLPFSACGPIMEAERPTPVDMTKFKAGESRLDVLSQLGAPISTIPNGNNSCDIYKLYTSGPNAVGKGFLAAGEVASDIVTIGLAEVIFTPVEGATKSEQHTVLFCYDNATKLISITDHDPTA
jgi:hypothetical protein